MKKLISFYLWVKNFRSKRDKQMPDIVNDIMYINNLPVTQIANPVHKYSEGENACNYIIFHDTASTTASSAHANFLKPETQASWHLTIDRDGKIYQLYDFKKIAWHAGKSNWKTPNGHVIDGLNPVSIGIEMVAAGPLSEKNGAYVTWYGQVVPNIDVFHDKNGNGWQAYTPQQKQAAMFVAMAIAKQYKILDIMGHEQIAPGRKQDPGPAFWDTMAQIRQTVLSGRYN